MKKTILLLLALCLFAGNTYSQNSKSKDVYVEIPYKLSSGIPVVEVLIKGKPYKFVVDTRALKTYIVRRIVDEQSLKLRKKTKNVGDGQGIRKQQQLAVINDMKVGGISFKTSEAAVSENDSYLFSRYDFDGIIGGDFLKRFVVKFDSRAKTITLTTDALRLVSDQQQWNKMKIYSLKTYIPIPLKGGGTDSYLFDSGSGMSTFDIDTARYRIYKQRDLFDFSDEETGYGATSVGLHGERAYEKRIRATAPELNVGGYIFRNVPVQTTRVSKIGFIVANYGDIILDYTGERYCFIPHQAEADWTDTRGKVGFSVIDSSLVVSLIWGEEYGRFTIGDKLVMIGNKRLDTIDRCYRRSISPLIKEHITTDNDTILFEKADGERYAVPADFFL
ncbi:MAG: retroviral-like aspartic protease family protein [Prevotellaceae bacterium]|jgi:hypothetical protein|nr:retroviral-like aspartic protease family protein [Prevotellaceae bacterium]